MSRHRIKKFIECSGVVKVSGCQVTGNLRTFGAPDKNENHKSCSTFLRHSLTKDKQTVTTATVAEFLVVTIIVVKIQIFFCE